MASKEQTDVTSLVQGKVDLIDLLVGMVVVYHPCLTTGLQPLLMMMKKRLAVDEKKWDEVRLDKIGHASKVLAVAESVALMALK